LFGFLNAPFTTTFPGIVTVVEKAKPLFPPAWTVKISKAFAKLAGEGPVPSVVVDQLDSNEAFVTASLL
jgi:hypothetical protein